MSHATSAFNVSSPSEGGQSISTWSCAECAALERLAQAELAPLRAHQFELRADQLDRGRHDVEPGNFGGNDCVRKYNLAGQHLVARPVARVTRNAEAGAGVALRVEIDEQNM